MVQITSEETGTCVICIHTVGMRKFWEVSSELITVDGKVKTDVLGFRNNDFSCGNPWCPSNDHAYIKLSGKEDW
jgi:hypothetical protein